MASEKNLSLIFKKIPSGYPVAGEHLTIEDRGYDASAAPPPGGVVTQNIYASLDPYMRGRMRSPEQKSYAPAFPLNEPIVSFSVSRVLKSNSPTHHEGDLLVGPNIPIQQYSALGKETLRHAHKLEPSTGIPDLRNHLGPLGMPGLTAYSSLYEIGKPQRGETIFISSAAGAVGQLVGHIAQHEGLTVLGSVGSDEKLTFITQTLGFAGGFNYRTEDPLRALRRLAPTGIDIYYDNVGGAQLEAALEVLNRHGRIVGCGMISQYNLPEADRYGIRNLSHMVAKSLTFRGFIVSNPDFGPKWSAEHQERVGGWIREGGFEAKFDETVGLENAAEGLIAMLKGGNFGKAVLKI